MRKLYLHVGTHKTGTTSLQASLAAGAHILRQHGIHRLNVGVPPLNGAHHNLAWEITQDARFRSDTGTLLSMIDEIETSGRDPAVPDVIMSSEEFECSISAQPAAFRRFIAEVVNQGFEVVIIVYLRDQVDYVLSLYFELLKHGLSEALDDFVGKGIERGFVAYKQQVFALRYDFFLQEISGLPGAKLVIRNYESAKNNLVGDLLGVLRPNADWAAIDHTVRLNEKLSVAESFSLFCRNRSLNQIDVAGVLDFLNSNQRVGISANCHNSIRQAFAHSNAKVSAIYQFGDFGCREACIPDVSLNQLFSREFAELFRQYSTLLSSQWTAISRTRSLCQDELKAQQRHLENANAKLEDAMAALADRARVFSSLEAECHQTAERLAETQRTVSDLQKQAEALDAEASRAARLEAELDAQRLVVAAVTGEAERAVEELAGAIDSVRVFEESLRLTTADLLASNSSVSQLQEQAANERAAYGAALEAVNAERDLEKSLRIEAERVVEMRVAGSQELALEVARAKHEANELHLVAGDLRQEQHSLLLAIEQLQNRVLQLRDEVKQKCRTEAQLNLDIAALRSSTSWKITAPMRKIRQLILPK
jgi:hypothetical protein